MARTNPFWLVAKPLLEQDYHRVKDIEKMSYAQVVDLNPEIYGKVPKSNFVTNWRNLKIRLKELQENPAQPKQKTNNGVTAWEVAKPLLEEDYLGNRATADMLLDQVIGLRPGIYDKVPRKNFYTNWKNLKENIEANKARARKDQERYNHDIAIYTLAKDLPWEWHGSEAESLLKKDVKKGRHLRYHPSVLFLKRDEYQEFDYEVFRKHIHQEARSALESPYWMVQKEKKEAKKKSIQKAVDKALQEAEQREMEDAFASLTI